MVWDQYTVHADFNFVFILHLSDANFQMQLLLVVLESG